MAKPSIARPAARIAARVAARVGSLALALNLLAVAGCASLPDPPPKPASHALADPSSTTLGRLVARIRPPGPRSGFRTIIAGDAAFDARVALVDAAQRTLDLQYYIVEDDASARMILEHARAAAVRGVRVRVLMDDMNTAGADGLIRSLMDQPNLEVRLFNPFPAGRESSVMRVVFSLGDVARINKRMHNKFLAADNAVAITGGRNLADAYFIMSPTSNFIDIDLLVAGAAVRPLSTSFDRFWNDPLAYPARMFVTPPAAGTVAAPAASAAASAPGAALEANPVIEHAPGHEANAEATPPEQLLSHEIAAGQVALTWAPARVLADPPSKFLPAQVDAAADTSAATADAPDPADADESLVDDMEKLLQSAKRSVVLVSPYFIPGEHGMQVFRQLRARGVSVVVLTNSLAANDAPLVHVGYARYREELLRIGVTLGELKPSVGGRVERHLGSFGSSTSRLHAKALVVDDEWSMLGTMNFDPRSNVLNSEEGVLIHSPVIARNVSAFGLGLTADAAYLLSLDDSGHIRWGDPSSPGGVVLADEPGASIWLKTWLALLAPFAPQEML